MKCVIKRLIDVFFVFDSIPNQNISTEMGDSIISEDPFSIRYVPDHYKTQKNV